MAALEAEVKADADAKQARKAATVAKLRDQRVIQTAGEPSVRKRAASPPVPVDEPAKRTVRRRTRDESDIDHLEDLGGALELAAKANRVKQELQRRPGKGEKSWIASGVVSLALGPVGWLYAGSLREAVPATAGWIALAAIASKILPVFLMWPALMVIMPLSAIAGVVYALQYNRTGKRERLFDRDDKTKPKQLRSGRDKSGTV